jgi:aspartyl/asparaginyl beta-hydroxylase (cupin superfamily)
VDSKFFSDTTRYALEEWAADHDVPRVELARIFDGIRPGPSRLGSPAPRQTPTVFFAGLRSTPFWDRFRFSWTSTVEAAVADIRADYESNQPLLDSTRLYESFRTDRGTWAVKYITCVGRSLPQAERYFPSTVKVLSDVPGALNCGMTYFSTITPRTHILPHSGFTNAHLRCHLALSTADGCRIRVGDETRTWVNGELLIFDDTYEHEVWNDSPNERVVLLFDVFHPDLSCVECDALVFLASVWRRSVMTRGLTTEAA